MIAMTVVMETHPVRVGQLEEKDTLNLG